MIKIGRSRPGGESHPERKQRGIVMLAQTLIIGFVLGTIFGVCVISLSRK